jgi:hypothetical protein
VTKHDDIHPTGQPPTPARRCDASDGTVTNDWELRDDNGEWQPWRHTTTTRID